MTNNYLKPSLSPSWCFSCLEFNSQMGQDLSIWSYPSLLRQLYPVTNRHSVFLTLTSLNPSFCQMTTMKIWVGKRKAYQFRIRSQLAKTCCPMDSVQCPLPQSRAPGIDQNKRYLRRYHTVSLWTNVHPSCLRTVPLAASPSVPARPLVDNQTCTALTPLGLRQNSQTSPARKWD